MEFKVNAYFNNKTSMSILEENWPKLNIRLSSSRFFIQTLLY